MATSPGLQLVQGARDGSATHEPMSNTQSDQDEDYDEGASDDEGSDGLSRSSAADNADTEPVPVVAVAPEAVSTEAPAAGRPNDESERIASTRIPVAGMVPAESDVLDGNGRTSGDKVANEVLGQSTTVVASTESRSPPMEPSVRVIGPVNPRSRSSASDGSSLQPNHHAPPYGRPIAPNGPAYDPYQGQGETSYYQPRLLQPEDGRVTATIPHKLRGTVDGSNGNFATIHMDLANTSRRERVSAAQRTSEATVAAAEKASHAALAAQRSSEAVVAAAERANRGGYRRPKRQSAHDDSSPSGHPQPFPAPQHHGFPARIPLPHETKMEQARLLTLLRSIHPNSIVDQLCKGLAYFGGVPGAPPPANGVFPLSDNYNGSGALFVNWLAEIFPPVYPAPSGYHTGQTAPPAFRPEAGQSPAAPQERPQSQAESYIPSSLRRAAAEAKRASKGPVADGVVLPKRKRGRPKGSKSSKPRKDKGIKKGPNAQRHTDSNNDASQVGAAGPSDTLSSQHAVPSLQRVTVSAYLTPNGKRRGRPPGSKNKPKPQLSGEGVMPILPAGPTPPGADGPSRQALPNLTPSTPPRLSPQTQDQAQSPPQQPPEASQAPSFPSPPATSASSLQATESRKRRLSDNSSQVPHILGGQVSAPQQLGTASANSQGGPDSAQPQKRRRASNGFAPQGQSAESSQTRSPVLPMSNASPAVNPLETTTSGSVTPASSLEGMARSSRPIAPGQGSGSQPRGQQTQTLSQQSAQWQQQQIQQRPAQQYARPDQSVSPVTMQSMQQPGQSAISAAPPQRQPPQKPIRQSSLYASNPQGTPQQQQQRVQNPPGWQSAMVGPQQAANPDAQPMAQQFPRYGVSQQQEEQRERFDGSLDRR